MTRMIRPGALLAAVVALTACRESAPDRLRRMQQRAANDASVASSSVVQSLRTSEAPGTLIYDPPIDLSYATLRDTRPDLDSANDGRRPRTAAPPVPRDTNRAEEQTVRRKRGGKP
jgi:hypothetical protein